MSARVRPVVCLVAIATLFAMFALVGASSTTSNSGSESSAMVAATRTNPRVAAPAQRGVPPIAVLSALGFASAALLSARDDRLIGRRLRRLRDVGHDWRALLIGAPPALA